MANDGKIRVTEVTVSYGRTVNLGEFNSLRVECTLKAEINQAEGPMETNHNTVADWLREECRNQCKKEADRLLEGNVR